MRRTFLLVSAAAVLASSVSAQSSEFGIRGIGLPGRSVSARAVALGGSIGLLDPASTQNPASLAGMGQMTSIFTMSSSWGQSANPTGSASIRETRFPHLLVGGPIPKTPVVLAVSYSNYAVRDFTMATSGIDSPRGVPVGVTDTLSARGGVNDMRIAASWALSKRIAFGGGIHFLTGSNRLAARRVWADSAYDAPQEAAELNFTGLGFSAGVMLHATPRLEVGALFRSDGQLKMRRDSSDVILNTIGLPVTLGADLRYLVRTGMSVSAQVTSRNWSRADAGIKSAGGIGADNTLEMSAGVEVVRNVRHPENWPLRVGARQATLPFLLVPGDQPKETGFTVGTGRRFSADRGGFDLSLERLTRSASTGYHETAWVLTIGISIHAGGFTP